MNILTDQLRNSFHSKPKKNFQKKTDFFYKVGIISKKDKHRNVLLYLVSGKEIKVETKTKVFHILKFQKLLYQNSQDWGDLIRWKGRKMFLERFLSLQIILLKERGKIQPECCTEKKAQNKPTEDSTTFLRKCLRKDFLQRSNRLHYTDKILLSTGYTGKLEMRAFLSRLSMMLKNYIPVLI